MSEDEIKLAVLVAVPYEAEASMIAAALEARGIRAEYVGGYTASFRAEAPGEVQVLVRDTDLPEAKRVLMELRSGPDQAGGQVAP